jgi:hypothetical protein
MACMPSLLPCIDMSAVNLPRLRIQSAKLMDHFDDPIVFVKELHKLLDSYADLTLRRSAAASPVLVLPTYRVPPAVIRQLELDTGGAVKKQPKGLFPLADRLWDDGYFETRLLAAFLIGQAAPTDPEFLYRLSTWVEENREPNVNKALLSTSMNRLRLEDKSLYIQQIEHWANPSHKKTWPSAIVALLPLLKDRNFHNLPAIYVIVQPVIELAPATLQQDLTLLISALYEASPVETTLFLRQVISLSTKPHTVTNLRRISPNLPEPLQVDLLDAIRVSK